MDMEKRLLKTRFSVLSALIILLVASLSFGLFLPKNSAAAVNESGIEAYAEGDVVLDAATDLALTEINAESKRLTGLTEDGLAKVNADTCTGYSVVIPANVTTIDSAAFNAAASKLVAVSFAAGSKLETITGADATGAFQNCTRLTSVTFATGTPLTTIGQNAFNGCTALEEINLDVLTSLSTIGANAFKDCASLRVITIPASVTSIGQSAFAGCTRVERLEYNAAAATVSGSGNTAPFANVGTEYNNPMEDGTSAGTAVTFGATVTAVPAGTSTGGMFGLDASAANVTSIDFAGSDPLTVGAYAFYRLQNLTSLTLRENTTLGVSAFDGTGLINPTIPSGVTLSSNTFANCTEITNLTYSGNQAVIGSDTAPVSAFTGSGSASGMAVSVTGTSVIPQKFLQGSNVSAVSFEGSTVTVIPASAFQNCTKLLSVTLISGIHTIGQNAFNGCTSLQSIDLTKVATLNDGAFQGCTNLNNVRLPSAKVSGGENYFTGCTNAVFICYNSSLTNNNHVPSGLTNPVTYPISITFTAEGFSQTEKRLYGYDYTFVEDPETHVWSNDTDMVLPALNDYSKTVWSNGDERVATVAALSALLKADPAPADGTIILTAVKIAKPTPAAVTHRDYDGTAHEVAAILGLTAEEFEYSVTDESGNAVDGTAITNAGTYIVQITLKEDYGAWDSPVTAVITIDPKVVDLNDSSYLAWTANADLNDGIVYVYGEAGSQEAYLTQQTGKTNESVKSVVSSYVRYSGNQVTLTLNESLAQGAYTVTGAYSGNTGTNLGVYTAGVVIKVAPNYSVVLGTATDSYARGLTITDNGNGEYTVSKTWYIVAMENYFVTTDNGNTEYDLSDRSIVFGGNDFPAAPYLHVGAQSNIKFRIEYNGVAIAIDRYVNETYGFKYYVNSAMPAGTYKITLTADGFGGSPAFSNSFTLTVAPKALTTAEVGTLVNAVDRQLKEKTFTYKQNGTVQLYEESAAATQAVEDLLAAQLFGSIHRENTYWGHSDRNSYYSSFSVTFNLNGLGSNAYYTQEELAGYTAAPVNVGTYTVYYQLSASNYNTLVDASSDTRRTHYFTVVIYDEVTVPTVANVTYNGAENKPLIDSSPLYSVLWLDNNYTNAGTYEVTFNLYDSVHYRWVRQDGEPINGGSAVVSFEIEKVDNVWANAPRMSGWYYEDFDATVNMITATAQYGDSAEVLYTILDADKHEITISGVNGHPLSGFALTANGQVPAALVNYLKALMPGTYYVTGSLAAEGSANWSAIENDFNDPREFVVQKGLNYWTTTPNVIQWEYLTYDKNVNLILAEARFGNDAVFTIKAEDGTVIAQNFTAPEGLIDDTELETTLRNLPRGYYDLFVTVAGSDTFDGMSPEDPFRFEVRGLTNTWSVMPNVIAWDYGDFRKQTNLFLGDAYVGDVKFTIQSEDGTTLLSSISVTDGVINDVDGTIAKTLNGLHKGTYKLLADVDADTAGNYEILHGSITFEVGQASNDWDVSLGIVTWVKGKYNPEENLISGTPYFGEVNYRIYEAGNEDNVIYDTAKGIDQLASAKVGVYILEASVDATDDFTRAFDSITFRVFAPEGLPWWATLIIVIGVLGVVALVLFILHEKGVLQMLTDKIVIAMRTKMTVDATIAAVRARQREEESKQSIKQAKARERLETLRKAREEAKNRPLEEQAAALEAKAAEEAEKAEKQSAKAEKAERRAANMQKRLAKSEQQAPETAESEAAATDTTPDDESKD